MAIVNVLRVRTYNARPTSFQSVGQGRLAAYPPAHLRIYACPLRLTCGLKLPGEVEVGELAVEFAGLLVADLGRLDLIVEGAEVGGLAVTGDADVAFLRIPWITIDADELRAGVLLLAAAMVPGVLATARSPSIRRAVLGRPALAVATG